MTLNLPDWMVERVVAILSDHPYTGAAEIVQAIKTNAEPSVQCSNAASE